MPAVAEKKLQLLTRQLQESVASISGLDLSQTEISVFYPTDRMGAGLGEELICFVEGLHVSRGVTRTRVANFIGSRLVLLAPGYLSKCKNITVTVRPFDPNDSAHFKA